MKPPKNDWYGAVSLGIFWLSFLIWILALVAFATLKPSGGDPGIFGFILFGIVLPGGLNLVGLILGIIGLSSLSVKSHRHSLLGTIFNLGIAILAVPVLMMLIHNTP